MPFLRGRSWRALAVFLALLCLPCQAGSDNPTNEPSPARLQISGFGLLGNRWLRTSIREVQPEKRMAAFDAGYIEDAFLILRNRMIQQGHLDASIIADLTLTDGSSLAVWWDGQAELEVPANIQVREARFTVLRGTLFYYADLELEGLTVLPPETAEGFFIADDVLLRLKTSRRFSPAQLQSSLANLRRELQNQGYRDARVQVVETQMDRDTGAVSARVEVVEGPRHLVRTLRTHLVDSAVTNAAPLPPLPASQPFSPLWEQDVAQVINRHFLRLGYPDAKTQIREEAREVADGDVQLDLVAEVTPGERVELGEVRFQGARHTRESFLQKHVRLEGPLLDRLEADQARERLSRLGAFKFVDLRLEPETGSPRDVVFDLTEGKRYELSLLAGYGSYDQLFGGVEFDHYNLWGVGHYSRFRGVQSFKSTQLTYTYTVPEFLAPDLSLFGVVDGFRREELTFDREELKLSMGVRRQFLRSGHQVGLRYSYEFLNAPGSAPITQFSQNETAAEAAAIIADWQLEQRDNPLLPAKGYRLYANVECANEVFGGQSDYVSVELAASWHHTFSRGLLLHLGLLHQVEFTSDRFNDLPFNKRFFPGGENSVRGYQRGGASPLDESGQQLGAEAVLQWNIEVEQRLTRAFSLVAFVDGAGVTPVIDNYPFDEVVWSAGAGVRWNTLIGPVRLEYGHNLTPRANDPSGTLQFSIGFPF